MAGGDRKTGNAAAVCMRCRYYYVTWEPDRPHGCKGFGFKSKEMPILVVRRADKGADCHLFSPKLSAVPNQD